MSRLLALLSLLASAAAEELPEQVPMRILGAGPAPLAAPALAIGSVERPIINLDDAREPRWLTAMRGGGFDVRSPFGMRQAAADMAVGMGVGVVVVITLPMPWRPTAIMRSGDRFTVRADAIDLGGATAADPDALAGAPRYVALRLDGLAPREYELALEAQVRASTRSAGTYAACARLHAQMRFTVAADRGARAASCALLAATELIRSAARDAPGVHDWMVPRSASHRLPMESWSASPAEEPILLGVGTLAQDYLAAARARTVPTMPAVRPCGPGEAPCAVIACPNVRDDDQIELRAVDRFIGHVHCTLALWHANDGIEDHPPHLALLVVPVGAIGEVQPEVVLHCAVCEGTGRPTRFHRSLEHGEPLP